MSKPPKSMLGKAFSTVAAPFKSIYDNITHQFGYDNARKGWDDDSPMSEYPKAARLKEIFKEHKEKYGFERFISPLVWTDLVSKVAKEISPNNNPELLPSYKHNTMEEDLKRFKPDEKRKQRLLASTAHDTERSFTNSLRTVIGMYWAKSGFKEVMIAGGLAAATLYCSKESVDVLAEFSNWGREFYDFFVQSGQESGAFKAGIVDAMRNAYDMNGYSSFMEVMQQITQSTQFNIENFDLASSLSSVRIAPPQLAAITEHVQATYGSLSLDTFSNPENIESLTQFVKDMGLPEQAQKDIITAVQSGVEMKESALEIIPTINGELANIDFGPIIQFENIINTFQMTDLDIKDYQEIFINGAIPDSDQENIVNAIRNNFSEEQIQSLFSVEAVDHFKQVKQDADFIFAQEVLQSSEVTNNTSHLLTDIPKDFGIMLGKFLGYILPAFYTAEHLALRWQTWMTGKLSNEWLKYKSAYHIRFGHTNLDNPDQRIQENLSSITSFVVDGTTDGMQNALKLAVFLPMLGAMGSFNPAFLGGPDIQIDNFLTWSALGYAAIGTGLLGALSWSLPKLNRDAQVTSADHRAAMISIHTQPEQIALMKGEKQEKGILKNAFNRVIDVKKRIINKSMQIRAFNSIHANVGSYVPFLLAAPQYFAGILSFGQVSQAMGIFRTVEGSFEFVKNMIVPFANFKAGVDRTAQLVDALELCRYEELERQYYMREAEATVAAKVSNDDDMPPPAHALDM